MQVLLSRPKIPANLDVAAGHFSSQLAEFEIIIIFES